MAVAAEEVITLDQVGSLAISLAQNLEARTPGIPPTSRDVAGAYRLVAALALAVKELADARRDDLDEAVARAKREAAGVEAIEAFGERVAQRFEKRAGKLGAGSDDARIYNECARVIREEAGL